MEERISFADAFALALAERLEIPLITTDHHEFDAVEQKGTFALCGYANRHETLGWACKEKWNDAVFVPKLEFLRTTGQPALLEMISKEEENISTYGR